MKLLVFNHKELFLKCCLKFFHFLKYFFIYYLNFNFPSLVTLEATLLASACTLAQPLLSLNSLIALTVLVVLALILVCLPSLLLCCHQIVNQVFYKYFQGLFSFTLSHLKFAHLCLINIFHFYFPLYEIICLKTHNNPSYLHLKTHGITLVLFKISLLLFLNIYLYFYICYSYQDTYLLVFHVLVLFAIHYILLKLILHKKITYLFATLFYPLFSLLLYLSYTVLQQLSLLVFLYIVFYTFQMLALHLIFIIAF